jgi:hypothetical protein
MRHLKNSLFWYILIIVIVYLGTLFWGVIAQANDNVVPHTKSNCVITQEIDPDTMIVLREKMVCRDGYIGPSYWEIFAQFYYQNVDTPSYCRWIDRQDHAYHTPVKVCLTEEGEWIYD